MPRARRLRRVLVTSVLTVGLAGVMLVATGALSRAQVPSPLPSPQRSPSGERNPVDAGRFIYLRDCAWCHGGTADGSDAGPSLIGVGTASLDFMLRTGRMPTDRPQAQIGRRPPAYTNAQVGALIDYLTPFVAGGPAIPNVDSAEGNLGRGEDLYQANCAACHSSTGVGGALTNGLVAPPLSDSSPEEVAEAMLLGGAGYRSGHMPKFGPDTFDAHDVDSIARYVLYLERPRDRGGVGLGHLGPVVEGFVTWIGLLLVLLVFVRWIGQKTS